MVALFQRYSEDFDKVTRGALLGLLLFFYRPGRPYELCPLDDKDRETAAMTALRALLQIWDPNEEDLSGLLSDVFNMGYRTTMLQWLLGKLKNTLVERERSIVNYSIGGKIPLICPQTMALMISKTPNLHRIHEDYAGCPNTPTSLAMYQPSLFFAWRDLVARVQNVEGFAEAELFQTSSPLANQGWTLEKLITLFRIDQPPFLDCKSQVTGVKLHCERCGRWERYNEMMVDLEWRYMLKSLRLGFHLPAKDTGAAEIPVAQNKHTGQVAEQYRFVCARECLDGLCVAWIHDDDGILGLEGRGFHAELATDLEPGLEACPTRTMPGAFVA